MRDRGQETGARGAAVKPLSGWEKRQLEKALLKGLGSLGMSAERLYKAHGWLADGRLALWCGALGQLAVLVDIGALPFRELRVREDEYMRDALLIADLPLWQKQDAIKGWGGECPVEPLVYRAGGLWWIWGWGYEERWQAIGAGWAYSLTMWPWPDEIPLALSRRGFPMAEHREVSRQREGVKA